MMAHLSGDEGLLAVAEDLEHVHVVQLTVEQEVVDRPQPRLYKVTASGLQLSVCKCYDNYNPLSIFIIYYMDILFILTKMIPNLKTRLLCHLKNCCLHYLCEFKVLPVY